MDNKSACPFAAAQNADLKAMLQQMDDKTRERFLRERDKQGDRYANAFAASCYYIYERACRLGISAPLNYYTVLGEAVRALCKSS